MSDQTTSHVSAALAPFFDALSARLEGEYGGTMEHLWIDVELIESHAKADGGARYPFRLQKRVSGKSRLGLPDTPDKENVGHFSVRPDFELIRSLSTAHSVFYAVSLVYREINALHSNRAKLGGLDSDAFLAAFRGACKELGHELLP